MAGFYFCERLFIVLFLPFDLQNDLPQSRLLKSRINNYFMKFNGVAVLPIIWQYTNLYEYPDFLVLA